MLFGRRTVEPPGDGSPPVQGTAPPLGPLITGRRILVLAGWVVGVYLVINFVGSAILSTYVRHLIAAHPDVFGPHKEPTILSAREWSTGWNAAYRVQRSAGVTLAEHTMLTEADIDNLEGGFFVLMVRRRGRVSWPATGSLTLTHTNYQPICVYQTRARARYRNAPADAILVDLRIPRPKAGWPAATSGLAAIRDGASLSSRAVRRYPTKVYGETPMTFSENWYDSHPTSDSDYHGKTPGAGDWWILHAAHASDFAHVTALTGDPWSLERWPDWALVAWPAQGPRPGVVIGGRRIDLGDAHALARYGITARHVPPVHGLTP